MKARRSARAERRQAESAAPVVSTLVWVILGLAVLGVGVAGYLAVTYLNNAQLVCYGLGDCDRVQTSAYARVYGVPVAVFGLLAFVAIAALALVRLVLKGDLGYLAVLGVWTLGLSGSIFSAYLTYVEFFVIYAACPWCLTSAALTVVISLLAWLQMRIELKSAS
ncbi:MAG: vitamin K epoxide reductase family protein [Chloroflexota bacterium]